MKPPSCGMRHITGRIGLVTPVSCAPSHALPAPEGRSRGVAGMGTGKSRGDSRRRCELAMSPGRGAGGRRPVPPSFGNSRDRPIVSRSAALAGRTSVQRGQDKSPGPLVIHAHVGDVPVSPADANKHAWRSRPSPRRGSRPRRGWCRARVHQTVRLTSSGSASKIGPYCSGTPAWSPSPNRARGTPMSCGRMALRPSTSSSLSFGHRR